MYDLKAAFQLARGKERSRDGIVRDLRLFADRSGMVPEPGDSPDGFTYDEEPSDWDSFVSRAVKATAAALSAWQRESTGPPFRTGYLLTATWQCGLGKHEACPGWGSSGRWTQKLRTLDGAFADEAKALCACACRHAAGSASRTAAPAS